MTVKTRSVIQGQHRADNSQGLVSTDAPTWLRAAVNVFLQIVTPMKCRQNLRGVDMSCVFLRGKRPEFEEPLFSEPLRGLPGIEKGALIEIVKGVFVLPLSLCGWWKELRDVVQDPAVFCLQDPSGDLIGKMNCTCRRHAFGNERHPSSQTSHFLASKVNMTTKK